MVKPKITIVGGFGGHNMGDDAQLFNNIRLLKKSGHDDITVLSPNPYIRDLCQVKVMDSFWPLFPNPEWGISTAIDLFAKVLNKHPSIYKIPQIRQLDNADILFMSGSGMINTRNERGLCVALLPIFIAKHFNKRIILSGQGITPSDNHFLTPFITLALNYSERIVLRDFKLGEETLSNLNVLKSKIRMGCDDAFSTPRNQGSLPDLPKNSIAINVSHYSTNEYWRAILKVANQLKKDGYNPIFNYFQDTEKSLVEDLVNNQYDSLYLSHPEEVAWFYNNVIACIGMRYHSFIFSIAGLSPVINVYTNEYQKLKIKAIQDFYNMPYSMIDIRNVNEETLYHQFQMALIHQPGYLLKINKQWQEVANRGVDLLNE